MIFTDGLSKEAQAKSVTSLLVIARQFRRWRVALSHATCYGQNCADFWTGGTVEQWLGGFRLSTSRLQRYVSRLLLDRLGQYTIRENTRPDWLITDDGARLELDFLIEGMGIAIEVQGEQHYFYSPHFHKEYSDFMRQLEHDRFKRRRCEDKGIRLIEITSEQEARNCISYLLQSEDPIVEIREYVDRGLDEIVIGKYNKPERKKFRRALYAIKNIVAKTEHKQKLMTLRRRDSLRDAINAVAAYVRILDGRLTNNQYSLIYMGLILLEEWS